MEAADPKVEPPQGAAERVPSRPWDHDHCAFCWAKFMAADYAPEQREWREAHPEILTAGYTPVKEEAGRRIWICPTCFEDFREQFGWTVIDHRDHLDP